MAGRIVGTDRRADDRRRRRWSSAPAGCPSRSCPTSRASTTFQGEIFHSARWDHDFDLTGKRVAVIGTGASAIQIVPEMQQVAGHLDVYQRTAPWVIPRNDRDYTRDRAVRCSGTLPACSKAYRTGIYWAREGYVPGFTLNPKLALPGQEAGAGEHRAGHHRPRAARRR